MNHTTRQAQILATLEAHGEWSIEQFAQKFATSGMTVRRDLQTLAEQGRIIRTHGGAIIAPGVNFEFAFLKRREVNQAHKRAIGRVAAAMIADGQSVLLDSGTTTLAIAEALQQRKFIKVITTSLPIASMLRNNTALELNLLGGQLRAGSPDISGIITESNLDLLCADFAFVGTDAVDEAGALYTKDPSLRNMLTRMIRSATRPFIVADSSKLARKERCRFGNLDHTTGLITDDKADKSFVAGLVKHGIRVFRASSTARRQ